VGIYIMGVYGEIFGPLAGELIGTYAGKKLEKYTGMGSGAGGAAGKGIGTALGKLAKYKKGGRVKRTGKAIVHKGEYVLPRGVKPTKAQMKKVAKKRKCKGGKRCKCKRK
jgi:hypothetical protein